jgi:outer membrane protein assembly factor BamA
MRRLARLAALALFTAAAGCAKAPAPAARAPAAAVDPLPACPERVERGGKPFESAVLEGKPIARTCLVGGSSETRARAAQLALLHAGDTLTAERVRADLVALLKLEAFAEVAAYGTLVERDASVVLLYEVADRPLVLDVRVEGAKALGDAALKRQLVIKKGAPYDPQVAHRVALGVRDGYITLGYEACKVAVITEPEGGQVRVGIMVDEGPQSRLAKIDFKGQKRVTDADLLKATRLTLGQPYVEEEVERAVLLVSALLYDRGLVAMSVTTERGKTDAAGNVPLTFVIDEGDVHTFSAIHVTGVGAPFEKELLEKVVRARPRQAFARSALLEDIGRLEEFFKKRGQRVNVLPQTAIDAKKHTIELTILIEDKP